MKNYSISKTIALSLGVLAMSLLISFMVLAWTEPGVTPPDENVAGPLLSEPDDLNLAGATWDQRNITNIDILSGFEDLFLRGNSDETGPVYMGGSQLKFYTGGTERMTINSSGNVGIGMTSPQGKLEVQGDMWITFSGDNGLRIRPGLAEYQYGFADQYGYLQAFINEQGATNQAFVLGDTSSTSTGILFGVSVGSNASDPSTGAETWIPRFAITGVGNVGIGTTVPEWRLHAKDGFSWGSAIGVDATGTTGGRRWTMVSTGGTATEGQGKLLLKDETAGVVRLTINTAGNVGIGTASPTQKLDVDGNIRVRGVTSCDQLGTDYQGNIICFDENPYCLEQGTLIVTPEGLKKIEELKPGDYVMGYKDGKEVEAQITETFVHDGEWTLYNYQGSWFTGNHKVSTDFENFEKVSELTDITKQYTGKVYNLEVAWTENYFGENNLLIHNK